MSLSKKSVGYLNYLKHIPLILISIIWIFPFLWMLSTSLKTQSEVFGAALDLIPNSLQFDNYVRAWVSTNFNEYFMNSVILTIIAVIVNLIFTSMAGYALGRRDFVGKKFFLGLLVASMFIPNGFAIIPLYDLIDKMGLLGTRWALIAVLSCRVPRIFIMLFMGYFAEIPRDLEDAASIDGCGFFRTFFSIMLPIAKPIVATVIIFKFLWTWNEFLFSLIFTVNTPSLRTVSVGIYSFMGQYSVDWTAMAAATTMALLPTMLVFMFFQKYFVRGMSGAVKG